MAFEQHQKQIGIYPMNISGNKTDCPILEIPLRFLKLDPNNARFKHVDKILTDKEIEEKISEEPDSKSLLREIKFSRGLSEQPFVKKIGETEYLVIEGNRRTTCLRKIASEIKSSKEKEIPIERIDPQPCIVLPETMTPGDIAILLTRLHASGKKDWPAMNKGLFVYELIEVHGKSYDEVSKECTMGKSTITQNVKAYRKTLAYHEKHPDDEAWLNRFSHFLELYKKRALKDWVENPDNIEEFMKWIHKKQIPMAIHVRKLDKILEDNDAYESLKRGDSIERALEIFQQNNSVKQTQESTSSQMKNFQILIKEFPRNKMLELAENEPQRKEFEKTYEEFGKLLNDINALR